MAGGGAGDLIFHYFTQERWRLIRPVKERFPNVHITAIFACHTGSEYELAFLNPHINSFMIYRWYPPGDPKEHGWQTPLKTIDIKEFAEQHHINPEVQTGLFLSECEKQIVKKITDKPYIAIHPFAGLPHRGCKKHPNTGTYRCFPDYKYVAVAKILKDKGYRVVIVGKTNTSYDSLRANDEYLDLPFSPEIIDMTNEGSLRTNTYLCRNAIGFIGSHSSMLSAAWTNNVPSVFFYPAWEEGTYRSVREYGGDTGTWALDKPFHSYYEMKPEEFVDTLSPEEVANKLFENIGRK